MKCNKFIIEIEESYLVCTIKNPPVNALSEDMLSELDMLLDRYMGDDEIRAIIITGAGSKFFSAGADLSDYLNIIVSGKERVIEGNDVFFKIENYPKPVIAAVQGTAIGGGLELAMSCHLRVISSSALLGMPELKLGFIPGWGGTQRLPRLIGKTKAMELLLTGRFFSPDEALQYGLANRVTQQDMVLSVAKEMARNIIIGSRTATEELLKVVNAGLNTDLKSGVRIEMESREKLINSREAQERTMAFLRKKAAK
ncbi:MAG: enoyl-CoA hydratase/isomerase family protein [Bacillota bacterium]